MATKFQTLTTALAEVTLVQLEAIKSELASTPTPVNISTEIMVDVEDENVSTLAAILNIQEDAIPHGYIIFHCQESAPAKGLVGLKVYNSKKELKGTVTSRHISGTDDVDVLEIDGDWEVPVRDVSHVLWTLTPDTRHEHIELK